jgi:polyketide synthase 12/epothilone polyketide synthase D
MTPEDSWPLSKAQELFWWYSQPEQGLPARHHHLPVLVTLRGKLDLAALESAIGRVVERHAAFRTVFLAGPVPRQTAIAPGPFHLPFADLEGMPPELRTLERDRLIREATSRPFDLYAAPPWRALLLRLGEDHHELFLVFHHIICDAWSERVAIGELAEIYRAGVSGETARLEPVTSTLFDFAQSERQRLESGALDAQVRYWAEQMRGAPEGLDIPVDVESGASMGSPGRVERFAIPPDLFAQIEALARRHKVTPFTVVFAGFSIWLHRVTGQTDLWSMVAVANRVQPAWKNVIGCLAQQMPIRIEVAGNPSFLQVIQRVRSTVWSGLRRQEAPYLGWDERPAANTAGRRKSQPLVAEFVYQNTLAPRIEAGGLSFETEILWDLLGVARRAVVCQFQRAEHGLDGLLEYRSDLFRPQTAKRWVSDLVAILRDAVAAPHRPLDQIAAPRQLAAPSVIAAPEPKTGVREPIAIVGIACRFPGGADNPEALWELLRTGGDAIREIPADRWDLGSFYSPNPAKPGRTFARYGGFLANIDGFDAPFFGIAPREAAQMDPEQRLVLELSWEALDDAGLSVADLAGQPAAVFMASAPPDYITFRADPASYAAMDGHSASGGSSSVLSNRISYTYDLRGPSVTVDTACSGSLVAIHQACQSIWHSGCILALAGGVQINVCPANFVMFAKASLLSPTGRCRAFDAAADGFVRGEGAGIVVLKPLSAARRDNDRVYATIRGTAVNQDGRTPSLTMPSFDAQAAAIREALGQANVAGAMVQYVEAHGPGTQVGDPIEARALGTALGRRRTDACVIGSIKTNIGHLEASAGVAGAIKLALSLWHRQIPPNLHFQTRNPKIQMRELALRVPTALEAWPPNRDEWPRLGGVNSFGFGGTNAHALLEEADAAPEDSTAPEPGRAEILLLSARSEAALAERARTFQSYLAAASAGLHDIAYTAAARRSHHTYRLAVTGASSAEWADALRAFVAGEARRGTADGRVRDRANWRRPVFVFSGIGQQHARMGYELFATEPVFHDAVLGVDAELKRHLDFSVADVFTGGTTEIDRTEVAQVAILAMQVGLAALWRSWGFEPEAVVGHSAGEVAAAYVSGALSLADAARVVCTRAKLQAETAGHGGMLAVGMAVDALRARFPFDETLISVAAVNSPQSITLAGNADALLELASQLNGAGVFNRPLKVEVPYHSPAMEPLMPRLVAALAGIRPQVPNIRLISTLTGQLIAGAEMTPPYWASNMRAPVRFADAIAGLRQDGCDVFIEIAAHPVLGPSLRECLGQDALVLASVRRDEPERTALLAAIGKLFVFGYPLDARRLFLSHARLTSLPAYPWQKARYWLESDTMSRWRLGRRFHPLLSTPASLPFPAWYGDADLDRLSFLRDHRLRGETVLPFTACLEAAAAAAGAANEGRSCGLADIRMEKALILLEDSPNPFCVVVDPGRSEVSISSPSGGSFIRHFTARVVAAPPEPPPLDIAAIRQRCPHVCGGEEVYQRLRERGFEYGPAFRGVKRAWFGDGEALFEVEWPETLTEEASFIAHPAMVDAYLNGVPLVADASEAWIPVRCDEIAFLRAFPRRGWSYARLTSRSGGSCSVEFASGDGSGRLSVFGRGMQYRALATAPAGVAPCKLIYRTVWEPQPLDGAPALQPGARWLIFADSGGVGERLASLVAQAGGSSVLAFPGDETRAVAPGRYTVRARHTDDLRVFLRALGPVNTVVHLWGPDPAKDGVDPVATHEAGHLSLLFLTQALVEQERVPHLCLIVRDAWCVVPGEIPAVGAASTWGLGRTILAEHPALRVRLIDLGAAAAEQPEAVFREIACASPENEVALRGAGRWVPRVERAALKRPAGSKPCQLVIREPGSFENLIFTPAPPALPAPGEVAIEVAAAGVNFKDVVKTLGRIDADSLRKTSAGQSLGAECAGRVIAVGPGVTGVSEGDEVMAIAPQCFGTVAMAPARFVVAKPERMTFAEAATLPVAYLTAYYALRECARIRKGERILIHSAAGGVGQAALRIAERLGAEVFATAGSESKREFLRSQGVKLVMDSRSLAFAQETLDATGGEGLDVVINTLPPATIPKSLETLRPRGRFVDISNIYSDAALDLRSFQKGLSASAFDLDQLMRTDPDFMAAQFREAMTFVVENRLPPLVHQEFPLHRAGDAFRLMARAQHVGKLVLIPEAAPDLPVDVAAATCQLRADATYLVTGGTRGFGLYTARWLAGCGARHLALLSRSGRLNPEDQQTLADLAALGVGVRLLRADVSKREEVAEALREIEASMPPLRGIVHAANIYADTIVANLDADSFRRVMLPKALGAWNLHCLTRALPLDFFVLYSSVAALFGRAGLAAYAAANAFLDGLAEYRHALGLPALAAGWGPLAAVGEVDRRQWLAALFQTFGFSLLQPEDAVRSLAVLLELGAPAATVMDLDWNKRFQESHVPPRFSRFVSVDAVGQQTVPIAQRIAAADPENRPALLADEISRAVAAALGSGSRAVDRDLPLTSLGLDSLLAVELSIRLARDLQIEVSSVRLLSGPTINLLAHQLAPLVAARTDNPHKLS